MWYTKHMKLNTDTINQARELVLRRVSYAKAAKTLGVEVLDLLNAMRTDPALAAARAQGKLNQPKRKAGPDHYRKLPHVIAVLGGMSQTDAAAQFGKTQPQISRDVKHARAEVGPDNVKNPEIAEDQGILALATLVRERAERDQAPPMDVIKRLERALSTPN
jgi:hypothetical protein